MKTEIIKLADIVPADYNPRRTLKPGDAGYEALKNSLERFKVAVPLVVNERTGKLVSGHQRLNVLLELGEAEVEVVLGDWSEDDEKLLNIAMNKIDGDWDYKKLETLFEDIKPEDIKFTGFTAEELDNLFGDGNVDWNDKDEENDETTDGYSEETETLEKAQILKDFNIFLSFPTKELAESWLKKRGVDLKFEGTARNITIRMEGLDYDKGN